MHYYSICFAFLQNVSNLATGHKIVNISLSTGIDMNAVGNTIITD